MINITKIIVNHSKFDDKKQRKKEKFSEKDLFIVLKINTNKIFGIPFFLVLINNDFNDFKYLKKINIFGFSNNY